MKKLFVMVLALFFVTATSGLVFADGTAAPSAKTMKHKKKSHKKSAKKIAEKKEEKQEEKKEEAAPAAK